MSRCIPYPPPGYEARKVDKSLIESIKLQRETEKAKKEKRKEKKREKKEKKEKSREDGVKADKNRSSLKRHKEERKQLKNYPDKKYEVVEQLEKSSLTVEYGQPANVGRRLGSSDSDSTQNSSCKRKRADPLCSQGSGLRIRLSLLKNRDLNSFNSGIQSPTVSYGTPDVVIVPPVKDGTLLPKESKYQSQENKTSGSRISLLDVSAFELSHESNDIIRSEDHKLLLCRQPSGRMSEFFPSLSSKHHKETTYRDISRENKISEHCCSTSARPIEPLPVPTADGLELHPKEKKHKHRSRGQMMDAKFRQLFVGWCPPPSEKTLPDCDDEDWLSQRKRACIQEAKRSRVGDDELWRAGPGGPRACFMVEANFYALPYMLPF
ncbi:uncharacterized protein [Aristolochia californica]|uniref:uncharacterized protein isoform X1 n=1 Tax=Aristolochia californica TaxID=171875 RepID=UPI0035DB710D